jgi:flagellar basal-body rod protein FlgB
LLERFFVSTIFRGIEAGHRALDYHLERHNVLSSNVANVDTPGFRPMELVRERSGEGASGALAMQVTAAGHMALGGSAAEDTLSVAEERVVNPGNDENSVSLEHELSKLGANHLGYETAARIVQQRLAGLRYAAGDGSSA